MIALGSITEGPSPDMITKEFDPAYPSILQMLSTSHSSRVRYGAAWLISQLTKNAPNLLLQSDQNLATLIDVGI